MKADAQKHTSKATSINTSKRPAVFGKVEWKPGINFDNGCGQAPGLVTDFLRQFGVENIAYDKYWQTEVEQKATLKRVAGKADTSTVANVLNVIQEAEVRQEVLRQSYTALRPGGILYVWIYEGNQTGVGGPTSKGWQENRKAGTYTAEVARLFEIVGRKGQLIIAKKSEKSN